MNHTSRGSMKCLVSGGPSCLLMHSTPSVEHDSFKSGRGGSKYYPHKEERCGNRKFRHPAVRKMASCGLVFFVVPSLFLLNTQTWMKISWCALEGGGSFSPGGLTWIRIFLLQTRGCVLSGPQLTDLTAVILSATGKKYKKTSREGVKCGEELFITVTNTTDYESYHNFVNLDYFNLILSVFRTDII